MISSMVIRNFKSIKNLNLNCKRVNVFIGEPNSGKSNILEVIGLLSHLCYGKRLRDFVSFETMRDLFYDKVLDFPIEIRFDDQTVMIEFKDGKFKCRLGNRLIFDYDYYAGGSHIPESSKFSTFKFYRFTKQSAFPDQRSEFLIPPYGENLLAVIITRKKLRASIKEIFDAFGYKVVFKPEEGKMEIQKELEDIIFSLSYPLVSETLQRIIFFLAATDSNTNSVLAFEEPEAHAFPHYTKYLAERIALDKKNQYFISTHNPYFLLPIIEKTPREELAVFLTFLKNYQTEVQTLTEKRMQKLLKMNFDLFFGLDELLT